MMLRRSFWTSGTGDPQSKKPSPCACALPATKFVAHVCRDPRAFICLFSRPSYSGAARGQETGLWAAQTSKLASAEAPGPPSRWLLDVGCVRARLLPGHRFPVGSLPGGASCPGTPDGSSTPPLPGRPRGVSPGHGWKQGFLFPPRGSGPGRQASSVTSAERVTLSCWAATAFL